MIGECSIPILEAALAGRLPADDEAWLAQHLGECETCALAMERLCAEPEWRDAATQLAADELDDALSGAGAAGDWSEVDFTVEHLEPADEPGVLGRLGGYDVLEIIGRGGMGVVLKAFDRELKRCVAIKVLAPHLANSSQAKKRFAREARAAAAVVHPHVLAIHQVRAAGTLPFLVMPLVSGESLAQRLARQGSLELREVLRIGMQAAAGLSAAHDQGLVHRDVKPANILLETGVERAVLTDFGLARAADDAAMTRLGIIAGTPQYMSPEQAKGEPLDGRSDLFSLGCVLFEMATGVSPFRADSALATMRRLVEEPPPALASLNPELPPWFVAIVQRLLEKDPANRFGSAREVSELLEGCLAHLQHPAAAPLPASLSKPVAPPAPRRRSYRTLGVIAMMATLGLVLCGAMAMFATDPPDIAGAWSGEDWGKVVLKKTGVGEYAGTYTDTFGKDPGEIKLKWSRIERRYNGTWREGDDRFGNLSVRLVDGEIRGAHTTDAKSRINPATPGLADLAWVWAKTAETANDAESRTAAALEKQRNDQKIKVADLEARIARLNKAIADNRGIELVPQEVSRNAKDRDTARSNAIEERILRLKVEILEKSQNLALNHPEMKLLEAKMKLIQKELASVASASDEEIVKQYRQGLATELMNAKAPIAAIEPLLDASRSKVGYKLLQTVEPTAPPAESGPPRVWAIAKYPTAGSPWWTAEGRVLPAPPVDSNDLDLRGVADPKLAWYSVLLRVPGGFDSLINGDAIRAPGRPWIWMGRQYLKTRPIDDAVSLALGLPEDAASVDLTVEAATGPWRTVSILPGRRIEKKDGATEAGAEWRVTERGRTLRLVIEFPHADAQSRIAIKNAGKSSFTPVLAPDARSGSVSRIEVEIPGTLDLSGDVLFALQTRPYEKIHLGKVVLRPGSVDAGSGNGPDGLKMLSEPQPPRLAKTAWPIQRRIDVGDGVDALAATPDGNVLAVAGGGGQAVFLNDVKSGQVLRLNLTDKNEEAILAADRQDPSEPTGRQVNAMAFSHDGTLIAVGTNIGQVKLYDAHSTTLLRTFDDVDRKGDKKLPKYLDLHLAHGSVRSLAFSPDGKMLATCGTPIDYEGDRIERGGLSALTEGLFKNWDIKTGQRLIDFKRVYHNDVFDVAFSPDGTELASVGNGGMHRWLHLFDPHSGKLKRSITSQAAPFYRELSTCLAYSPDGKRLAVGFTRFDKKKKASGGTFAVVYPGSGILDWKQTSPSPIAKIAFTPDGTGVATAAGNEGVLKIWDASTGAERSEVRIGDSTDRARLTSFAFLPKARILALGGTRANGSGFVELRSLEPPSAARP